MQVDGIVCVPLSVIIVYQYLCLRSADLSIAALRHESTAAGEKMNSMAAELRREGGPARLALSLEETAARLGAARVEGDGTSGEVCPEKYIGNNKDFPYHYNAWKLEQCDYGQV